MTTKLEGALNAWASHIKRNTLKEAATMFQPIATDTTARRIENRVASLEALMELTTQTLAERSSGMAELQAQVAALEATSLELCESSLRLEIEYGQRLTTLEAKIAALGQDLSYLAEGELPSDKDIDSDATPTPSDDEKWEAVVEGGLSAYDAAATFELGNILEAKAAVAKAIELGLAGPVIDWESLIPVVEEYLPLNMPFNNDTFWAKRIIAAIRAHVEGQQ